MCVYGWVHVCTPFVCSLSVSSIGFATHHVFACVRSGLFLRPHTYQKIFTPPEDSSNNSADVSAPACVMEMSLPPLSEGAPDLAKYFAQRYRLFSRFDEGVQLDVEGWYR
jgi:hypothetical protein